MTHHSKNNLEQLVRRLRDYSTGDAPAAISPEDAFLAWLFSLPLEAHIPSEARVAIQGLEALKARYSAVALERFEGYLRDATRVPMPTSDRSRRRPGGNFGLVS